MGMSIENYPRRVSVFTNELTNNYRIGRQEKAFSPFQIIERDKKPNPQSYSNRK